jgi:hypothetical protein
MQLPPQRSNAQVEVIFVKIIVQTATIKRNILVKKYKPTLAVLHKLPPF